MAAVAGWIALFAALCGLWFVVLFAIAGIAARLAGHEPPKVAEPKRPARPAKPPGEPCGPMGIDGCRLCIANTSCDRGYLCHRPAPD